MLLVKIMMIMSSVQFLLFLTIHTLIFGLLENYAMQYKDKTQGVLLKVIEADVILVNDDDDDTNNDYDMIVMMMMIM